MPALHWPHTLDLECMLATEVQTQYPSCDPMVTSVSGLWWAVLKGLLHVEQNFMNDVVGIRSLSVASCLWCLQIKWRCYRHKNRRFYLWCTTGFGLYRAAIFLLVTVGQIQHNTKYTPSLQSRTTQHKCPSPQITAPHVSFYNLAHLRQ
jgi:hypothetical protein